MFRNNRYLLKFIDRFTRWVEAVPMVDQATTIVALSYWNGFLVFRIGPRPILHKHPSATSKMQAKLKSSQTADSFGQKRNLLFPPPLMPLYGK
ncbi:hypothetical protein AVEN_168238-1 [Araneus ventricosus]|uniref:Uncharacterized protein n=1 Tax=Araneus ventricosus TaxID=182803 RepID=A0A4Y2UUF8_ARAVE|nr:hypothetical protein AVEN_168238-1 [Araneus ventricosus]